MNKYIIFKSKGALKEKLRINSLNIFIYSILLHLICTLFLTSISINHINDIELYHLIIPLWGLLSYVLFANENINQRLYFIITLPLIFWINLIIGIFILKYKNNYPNVSIQNVDRYLKIKKLMK